VGFGLCLAFLPGDRHIVVGSKEGKLHLVDLASGDITQSHDAHEGAIWSLDVRPDGKGLMTGSADKEVKFWELELSDGRLGLAHTRTLKMSDDVLAVRYSRTKDPERLLVAVALLDSTVKVFYENSLRFFLSLYGHKLPVMAMDISDDNELIATASADKTVKIWGLDFGDCHRCVGRSWPLGSTALQVHLSILGR
jgi:U3 small nucleolar RNA-associated protein 12